MHMSDIPNTVSIDKIIFAPYNAPSNDRTNQDSNIPRANHRMYEDKIHEYAEHVVGQFTMQPNSNEVATCSQTKEVIS